MKDFILSLLIGGPIVGFVVLAFKFMITYPMIVIPYMVVIGLLFLSWMIGRVILEYIRVRQENKQK